MSMPFCAVLLPIVVKNSQHFATTNVIIDSGKDHQLMLKQLGEGLLGTSIFIVSKYHPIDSFLVSQEKGTFMIKKDGR